MLAGQTVGLQTWVNHLLTRRDGKLWPQPERQVCSSKPLRFMDVLKFTSDDLSQNMIVNRETHSEGEYFIFKVYYWGHCCWLFWTRWSRFQTFLKKKKSVFSRSSVFHIQKSKTHRKSFNLRNTRMQVLYSMWQVNLSSYKTSGMPL